MPVTHRTTRSVSSTRPSPCTVDLSLDFKYFQQHDGDVVDALRAVGLQWGLHRGARVLCVADAHHWAHNFLLRAYPAPDLIVNFDTQVDAWLQEQWHARVRHHTRLLQVYPDDATLRADLPLPMPAVHLPLGESVGAWRITNVKRAARPVTVVTFADLAHTLPPNCQVRHVFLCRSGDAVPAALDATFVVLVRALDAQSSFRTQPESILERDA